MLVGLCGYARSGKDEFFKALNISNKLRLAFADCVKSEIQELLNTTHGNKFDIINNDADKVFWRQLLVDWGDGNRRVSNDIWIEKLCEANKCALADTGLVKVITDVRYLNEAEWLLNNNGLLIYVSRENNHAANETEAASIKAIKDKLHGKLIFLHNGYDNLNAYHESCRKLAAKFI